MRKKKKKKRVIKRQVPRLHFFFFFQNMLSNKLLAEIVLKVVEFLEDDTKTLHSCILVSREWCKIAIPILWSNTFRQHKQHKPCHSPEGYQIISTYITALSEESVNSLN